ncbi:MAG: YjbH domain-containing protein [Lentilitoribacter sp.]
MNFYWPSSLQASFLGGCIGSIFSVSLAFADDQTPVYAPPPQPSLNFYGLPGAIDTPSATPLPDGQVAVGISHFAGTTRTTLSFQATPRISASFRYVGLQDFNSAGFETFRDRSFDVKFLAFGEGKYRPAVSIGLQDFSGTGIYASEYIVATKNFETAKFGKISVSGGLGWGRLGSNNAIGAPFGGARPVFDTTDTGGSPSFDQWFRGDAAPFASIEWQVSDKLGLKAEYSSDAYELETQLGIFERRSPLNFGVEYQYSERLRLGGYYLYGSELGFNAQLQLNPKRALAPLQVTAPKTVVIRPTRQVNPGAWQTDWATSESAPTTLRDILAPKLSNEGLTLESLQVRATSVELRVSNQRYRSSVPPIGRSARILAEILPPSVETFVITQVREGLALSSVTIRRSDLEALEFQPNAANALLAVAGIGDASPQLKDSVSPQDLHPQFSYSIGPYLSPSYFDPDEPARADFGLSAQLRYKPAPGWTIAGEVRHRLVGNIADSNRLSNSVLPRVRTDAILFAQAATTSLNNLYVAKQWKPRSNVFARVSAGYFESMFGGISTEVLWKPVNSRLAIGVEANYAQQRDFNQRLGFQSYGVATGHVSAYYEFGKGYHGQLDVGRYLAGDVGATVTMSREFKNGWELGGFFTLTNVSSEEFGEGSFDKGLTLSVPVSWFLGKPSKQTVSTVIRPIQRDGGARLSVPGRLYEQVRGAHIGDLSNDWSRVWE